MKLLGTQIGNVKLRVRDVVILGCGRIEIGLKAEIVKNGDGRNRKLGYSGWGGRGDGLRENSIRGQGKRERGRGRRWRVEESFTEEVKLKWSRVRLYVLVCMC